MITLTREEAQQVLDALEKIIQGCNDVERDEHIHKDGKDVARLVRIDCREPAETLRARLAQREWQALTTAETKALWNATKKPAEFAEMLQAKLREKNG
jgi:hypothetical protein